MHKKPNLKNIKNIASVAKKLGVASRDIELYGDYKCKLHTYGNKVASNLILVTATNPTPFGEGKTTISIGLADALSLLKKKSCLALREPSLGPVFGTKGGATGGGAAQLFPAEDINLHFNGDMHAITSANNFIASIIDNHIYQGNSLGIDKDKISFKRCLDLNDRALRNVDLGGRKDSFTITAASEIMATLCMSGSLEDLRKKISRTIVAESIQGEVITVKDLGCVDAVLILLKNAIKPNLVQTLEGTPAIVHGGPFANIALGCNSVIATKTALSYADYVVTEAGFGADLGAEKFLDIKARLNKLKVSCVVIVTTVRALKYNGGVAMVDIKKENREKLELGLSNLKQHISNLKNVFNVNVVVAVNAFNTDTKSELEVIVRELKNISCEVSLCDVWNSGGAGAVDLAKKVISMSKEKKKISYSYALKDSPQVKISNIAQKIYHADGVLYSEEAEKSLVKLIKQGFGELPVCIAKTQYSFSDNPKLLNAPTNFKITVKDVFVNSGAGIIVAVCGGVLLMPGLSSTPKYEHMRLSKDGDIRL